MRKPKMTRLSLAVLGLVATAGAAAVQHARQPQLGVAPALSPVGMQPPAPVGPPRELARPPLAVHHSMVAKHSSLSQALRTLGLSANEVHALSSRLTAYIDPRQVAAGTRLQAFTEAGAEAAQRVDLILGPGESLRCDRTKGGSWSVQKEQAPVERRVAAYAGVVTSSLWNSATGAGMDPQLVAKLAEIFAWQVDFHHEVRRGDRWRLTVERFYSEGQPLRFGSIIAAEYDNAATVHSAVLADNEQYYTPAGGSLQRMFLRSPLRYAHITSGFSLSRFHPILKISRPHHGIDYGAPVGTPVMAVGAGEVLVAARKGDSGNMIALRHGSTYETQYKHLSRFAPGIHPGARVKMGEVIAYVGQTGLATGPHLHFEFHVGGVYTDPRLIRFPSAEPVAPARLAAFKLTANKALAELPPWSEAVLTEAKIRGRDDPRTD